MASRLRSSCPALFPTGFRGSLMAMHVERSPSRPGAGARCWLAIAVALSTIGVGVVTSGSQGPADATLATRPATTLAAAPAIASDDPTSVTERTAAAELLQRFSAEWCLDCHVGRSSKAGFDLEALLRRVHVKGDQPGAAGTEAAGTAAQEGSGTPGARGADDGAVVDALRVLRDRLVERDMPPDDPRPEEASYEAAIRSIDQLLSGSSATAIDALPPRRSAIRRLSRVEYRNAVRDLFGVDVEIERMLPADEISHGFDNGESTALAPLLIEKYVDAAEAIAPLAVTDLDTPVGVRRGLDNLRVSEGGRRQGEQWGLHSNAAVMGRFTATRSGRYRLHAVVSGQQAGPDPVRMVLRRSRTELERFNVTGDRRRRETVAEMTLDEGEHSLGVAFINDYWKPDDPDPANRDRNAFVHELFVVGPMDAPEPTRFQRRLAEVVMSAVPDGAGHAPHDRAAARWRAAIEWLAARAWRTRPAPEEIDRVIAVAAAVAEVAARAGAETPVDEDVASRELPALRGPEGYFDAAHLRPAVAAILASPRFVLRREAEATPSEIAALLAFGIWSTVPEERLLDAAARGELATAAGRRAAIRRLVDDPRSLALAENFASQWLHFRGLETRQPDPQRFPGVDAALLASMSQETILLFDAVLRERRDVHDLLRADETFLDETLAQHYGVPGVRGRHHRRVSLGELRGPEGDVPLGDLGILRHASVLVSTSNPTRTSPVKRGKWVLEALLDDPPPPAPPDVPALPNDGVGREGLSLRELLEAHRADPGCAGCHRRMDAMGFALEPFDAVGRWRARDEGLPVDAASELDGRRIDGPRGLRDALLADDRFARSLLRHLATYILGRGLDARDEPWLAAALDRLGEHPTIEAMLVEIVEAFVGVLAAR